MNDEPKSEKCGRCRGTGRYRITPDAIRCFVCGGAGIVPRKKNISEAEYLKWWNSVKDKVKIYGEPVRS